jgi:AraC-like DNA-binding protein
LAHRCSEGTADQNRISSRVGYEDASFFRRVFKRRTGLVPLRYRRLFQPIRLKPPVAPVR